jgi:uncharacterized protein (DUF736 family)
MSQGAEIGAGWIRKGQTPGKDYVALSFTAWAVGQDDDSVYPLIWNPQ